MGCCSQGLLGGQFFPAVSMCDRQRKDTKAPKKKATDERLKCQKAFSYHTHLTFSVRVALLMESLIPFPPTRLTARKKNFSMLYTFAKGPGLSNKNNNNNNKGGKCERSDRVTLEKDNFL